MRNNKNIKVLPVSGGNEMLILILYGLSSIANTSARPRNANLVAE